MVCKVCDPGMCCRFRVARAPEPPTRATPEVPLWLAELGQEVLSRIVDVFAQALTLHEGKRERDELVELELVRAFPQLAPRRQELLSWLLNLRNQCPPSEGGSTISSSTSSSSTSSSSTSSSSTSSSSTSSSSGFAADSKDDEPRLRGFRGTNKYMAPEVFNSSRDSPAFYDPRKADVWSLGIVLFMLLFRGNPWNLPDPSDDRFKFIYTDTGGDPVRVARNFQMILESWRMPCEPGIVQLLSVMLCDAKYRWQLEAIVNHVWLQENPTDPKPEERASKQGRHNGKRDGK